MTANRGTMPPTTESGALGVHSLDHFVLQVPDLKAAERFYTEFGLDVRPHSDALALKTFGNDHVWAHILEGRKKKLHHVSFGCYADDLAYLSQRAEDNGVELLDAPEGFESNGFWMRDPAGMLVEVRAAAKSSADHKASGSFTSSPEGVAGAPIRAKAPRVRPRRFSHMLMFTPDTDTSLDFYGRNLGLRLADRAEEVAFMYGIHGSDHHILAFAPSTAPGMHHCSWDMGSIDAIGLAAMRMHDKGYTKGWGLGRHVLGSNYFHYIQDPWGSFAEYTADIDYIPANCRWQSGAHAPEDSFYLWGPEPPADFIVNYEAAN